MKEIELIDKRKPREKHFLKKNGIIEAQVFDEDIHFLKYGKYEEIDNTLIDMGNYYTNKNNAYNVMFAKTSEEELTKISIGDNYIKTKLVNCNISNLKENIMESKLHKNVCYPNIIDNVDLEYNVMPSKVKEAIVLKSKDVDLEKLVFSIETNLKLELIDKNIVAKADDKACFEFDSPYMVDANFKTNNDVNYELSKVNEGSYLLKLNVDKEWLTREDIKYPVMIDPTITNSGQDNSVYDTYIYPGDAGVDRNSQDILKAGIENINGTTRENRALIKFQLPTIGTGSQVVHAELCLFGYPEAPYNYNDDLILVHQITSEWDEISANWDNMHDKYNPLVEGVVFCRRGYYDYENETIEPANCEGDITRLVKKWYTGTPNHGIMLRQNEKKYNLNILPAFYSRNNSVVGANPKPVLLISYRNQNGILNHMDYQIQNFLEGNAYVNSYNGNLTTIFGIGSTIGGKMPIDLSIVYNTNDVVLNNDYGYGLGYKFSLHQMIKEQKIDGKTYLEYSDEDSTLHYFLNQKTTFDDSGYNTTDTENTFYDEDGLDMTITKNSEGYILTDKNGNIMRFIKNGNIAYLSEIEDINGNRNTITYDSKNLITKIVDANDNEINIKYGLGAIIVSSPDRSVVLNYSNNRMISIVSLLGITEFNYNDKSIITKIIDINKIKTAYEYYEQKPYKVKKVSRYGINDNPGEYFDLLYGFDSTTITDSKGNANNMIFNSQGGIVSKSGLKDKNDINNAYGISQINGTNDGTNPGYNNKLMRTEIPLKYVKNLLSNTSFENDNIKFIGTNNINLSISDEISETGISSLKAVSDSDNQALTQNVEITKGNYYTFSAYIKNTSKVRLELSYFDVNGDLIESKSELITLNENFERYDVTIYYPIDATSDLSVSIDVLETGTIYIDDIQLEEGEVANNYNLLENSDFSNGYSDWNLSAFDVITGDELPVVDNFDIVTLNNGIKALKTKLNPAFTYSMEKTFNISGKGGDVFNISFWYKNQGIDSNLSEYYGSRVYVNFDYINQDDGHCGIPSPLLNINDEAWQYVSNDFIAEKDYKSITIGIYHEYTANDFYITNMSLFKDIRNVYYEYDEFGNVILENNLDNNSNNFSYDKNNQIIKMTNPKGKNFMFEYDNIVSDRIINSISDMGISNRLKYDSSNNIITTKIIKDNIVGDISDGVYKLRLKGTSKYLRNISNLIKIKDEDCNHDLWRLEKDGEYFKIKHSIISDKYFTIKDNKLLLSEYNGNNSLFELKKNKNGSYLIKSKSEDKYLKFTNDEVEVSSFEENDYHFEFCFENATSNLFIENNCDYTSDRRFVESVTDTLLRKTKYNVDPILGFVNSSTDSSGNVIEYKYDEKRRKEIVSNGDKIIRYSYNDNGMISQIIQKNRVYNFKYDDFNKELETKINDKILSSFEYEENNGNLCKVIYGNNDFIKYSYDCFNRLEKVIKEDDIYEYKYNNHGDLVKIKTNNYEVRYRYDLGKKLAAVECDSLKIKYEYDSNNNIINKKIKIGNLDKSIYYTYDDDDEITKIRYGDDFILDYMYDSIGRLYKINIGDNVNINYEYITNGKRTSVVIKSMRINDVLYSYKYDKSGNITHIFNNNNLENRYYYDSYDELICEKNYKLGQILIYKYDSLGNIINKMVYDIVDYKFIYKDCYYYSDKNWPDLLTKFNNDIIIYDEIGNPLSIGDEIKINWINGKELSSYISNNKTIKYLYDHDGNRKSKIIDGVETKYVYENDNIIYEISGEKYIYYIYDNNSLIGFEYDGLKYYYLKNVQEDIIGILDDSKRIIVKYEYDSWGNIISIVDGSGNDIKYDQDNIGNINPFRYKSYYYDIETDLYYIKSRYYNPKWGRFINADGIIGVNRDMLTYNLFSYCSNNPILNIDSDGMKKKSAIGKKLKNFFKKITKPIKNTLNMFKHAFKGQGNKKVYGKKSGVSKSIVKSSQFQKEIDNEAAQFDSSYGNTITKRGSVSLYGSGSSYEIDNTYAMGKVGYELTFTRIDTKIVDGVTYSKFKVEGIVSDYYNFDDLWSPNSLKGIANDIGYLLEKAKIIDAYNWYATVESETGWVPTIT